MATMATPIPSKGKMFSVVDCSHLDDRAVYDLTQTDKDIVNGTVIKLSGLRFAIMVKAWPTMVHGESVALHFPIFDWSTAFDGEYASQVDWIRHIVAANLDKEQDDAIRNSELRADGWEPDHDSTF